MTKRLFDIFFSGIGLLILSPLFPLLAIIIKVDSPGSVFFRQERVGQNGKIFKIYKFRTMIDKAWLKGSQITFSRRDPRITDVGRFLRHLKLDEIPQLINVLKGEMSLVGPRPEIPKYVALYNEKQRAILSVRPGMTDLASLKYSNEADILAKTNDWEQTYINEIMPDKLALGLEYIKKRSLFLDLKIILKTIKKIFQK